MKRVVLLAGLVLAVLRLSAQVKPPVASTDSLALKSNTPVPVKEPPKKTESPKNRNITVNIAADKTLSKFFELLHSAGLAETFNSKGPMTIFVPDNDGFGKISKGRLDTLFTQQHLPELIALVTYHAIPGKLTAKDIIKQINTGKGKAMLTTLAGNKLKATIEGVGNIIFTDDMANKSRIKQTNIEQNNGMLFIIDAVLVPKVNVN